MTKQVAGDLTGTVREDNGGTGKTTLTSGSYLVGTGTSAVELKTPAQVREDIGALPASGGTLQGALVAQNNTNYTTKQVRNVTISTAEPTASDGDNGDVWIVYEAAT